MILLIVCFLVVALKFGFFWFLKSAIAAESALIIHHDRALRREGAAEEQRWSNLGGGRTLAETLTNHFLQSVNEFVSKFL